MNWVMECDKDDVGYFINFNSLNHNNGLVYYDADFQVDFQGLYLFYNNNSTNVIGVDDI